MRRADLPEVQEFKRDMARDRRDARDPEVPDGYDWDGWGVLRAPRRDWNRWRKL